MQTILYVILAIFLFGFLVFIHELGHFTAARACKVKVNEFSIGMGPRLLCKKSKKTEIEYSIRALPFGGFVSMDGESEVSDDTNAFCNKPVWQRIIILAAGPTMNLLLGFLLMIVLVAFSPTPASNTIAKFQDVAISHVCGLEVGDTIIEVDGTKVHTGDEVVYEIMMQGYEPIDIVVIRDGKQKYIPDVSFRTDVQSGIKIGLYDFWLEAAPKTFGSVIKHSFFRSCSTVKMVWDSLAGLIGGRFGMEAVSGPVGVIQQTTQVAQEGDSFDVLYLFIVISINLGVMNLLPIPALDGGHLVFNFLELIAGRPVVKRETENAIHAIALLILLGFIVIISVKDVFRLFA
ncbi:MAG: site-2 protease family protein [Clostridia bacterium]|nr:site-2 protease family protein [Clostridia bacterium]